MDEEKTTEEKKPEEPAGNPDEGNKSETDKKVEELNADTERINRAIAENLNAKARQKISGENEGGQTTVVKEETAQEYAKKVMANDLE